MEVTAPSAVLVVGFPLLLMLVMLLMNAVERRLTGSERSALRLVPTGGTEETATGDDGALAATTAAPIPPSGPTTPTTPTAPATDSTERPVAAEHRRTLRLLPVDLLTADLVPADATLAFTHSAVRAAEAGVLSGGAEAGYH
ncbi:MULTISPECIES: hypothetical protein [Pseudofrankia]|uniref:hypothetical protein n=1 Tax=Pseudofrankia TaxID=2994363 RepID=UPI0010426D2F|nr:MULTISPECIES: hypothetical protein [Pseudofrankia]